MKHRTAVIAIIAAAVLDIGCGVAYHYAEHVTLGTGLYCAVGNATTDGVCTSPATVAGHWINVLEFILVVPLVAATFSLFTSALTAERVHKRVGLPAEAAHRIVADLYKHHVGKDHPDAPGGRT